MSWDYWAKDCIGAPQWSLGFAETLNMWDLTAIMEIKGDMWFILHPFVFLLLLVLPIMSNMPTLHLLPFYYNNPLWMIDDAL